MGNFQYDGGLFGTAHANLGAAAKSLKQLKSKASSAKEYPSWYPYKGFVNSVVNIIDSIDISTILEKANSAKESISSLYNVIGSTDFSKDYGFDAEYINQRMDESVSETYEDKMRTELGHLAVQGKLSEEGKAYFEYLNTKKDYYNVMRYNDVVVESRSEFNNNQFDEESIESYEKSIEQYEKKVSEEITKLEQKENRTEYDEMLLELYKNINVSSNEETKYIDNYKSTYNDTEEY